MTDGLCKEHTGFKAEIDNLIKSVEELWNEMGAMRNRLDSIFMRLNIVLGGVAVACILLSVNLIIK